MNCDFCGAAVPARVLVCGCGRLVYGKRLATLAARAEGYEESGATGLARSAWQEALGLLPPDAAQAREIQARIGGLEQIQPKYEVSDTVRPSRPAVVQPTSTPPGDAAAKKKGIAGVLSAIGIAIVKFGKAILLFGYKLKWLLKATKFIPSLLSMALYLWIYIAMFGAPFAIGFVLLIWIHEMGHVAMLVTFGKGFELPMFIPFMGAYVRGKKAAADVVEQAWISLGGPLLGAVGAYTVLGVGEALDSDLLRMLGQVGVWLNLFQLVPFWIFDGARAAAVLDLPLWFAVTGVFTASAFYVGSPWIAIICLFVLPSAWRARKTALPGTYEDVAWGRRLAPALVLATLASGLLMTDFALTGARARVLTRSGRANDIGAIDSSLDAAPEPDSNEPGTDGR